MVDFGGWELPQQYTSIREEHIAVRKVAGLFDISHMGRFQVTGEAGLAFLQSLLTNDLSRIGRGRAQYNLMCDDHGGILDDLVSCPRRALTTSHISAFARVRSQA